jgi:Transposase IS200 like.
LRKTLEVLETQTDIHAVFAVQNRLSLIDASWETELYRYITSIVHNQGHKLLQTNMNSLRIRYRL